MVAWGNRSLFVYRQYFLCSVFSKRSCKIGQELNVWPLRCFCGLWGSLQVQFPARCTWSSAAADWGRSGVTDQVSLKFSSMEVTFSPNCPLPVLFLSLRNQIVIVVYFHQIKKNCFWFYQLIFLILDFHPDCLIKSVYFTCRDTLKYSRAKSTVSHTGRAFTQNAFQLLWFNVRRNTWDKAEESEQPFVVGEIKTDWGGGLQPQQKKRGIQRKDLMAVPAAIPASNPNTALSISPSKGSRWTTTRWFPASWCQCLWSTMFIVVCIWWERI